MITSYLKQERIESKAYREAARGQPCTVQIEGACDGGGATTIFAHLRDRHAGKAQKASDTSGCDCCFGCHDVLDRRARMPSTGELITDGDWHFYALRGLQATIENRWRRGIIGITGKST